MNARDLKNVQREYIGRELDRYVPSTQLALRIEDRLTECRAKGHNPLDWYYVEVHETVNFKTAVYFRWERKHVNRGS